MRWVLPALLEHRLRYTRQYRCRSEAPTAARCAEACDTNAEANNQCQAFNGKGTRNAAGAKITALKPSMRARRDILSFPAFKIAFTTACAGPDTKIKIEAVFSIYNLPWTSELS
jgi:hypothetical protein